MEQQDKLTAFERSMIPHIDAAYNLARWLVGRETDAEDVVQESFLRAYRFFESYRGGDARSWLLRIVRNAAYDWLKRSRRMPAVSGADDEVSDTPDPAAGPDLELLRRVDAEVLMRAIESLPVEYRELFLLREMEGLSYKELSDIADVPLGTVMSRLARARRQLRHLLAGQFEKELK